MSFSPFVDVSRGAVTDINNNLAKMDHDSRHRHHPLGNGLKKWLSLRRLNSAYQHSKNNKKNPKVLTRKRNRGHSSMPPHQRQSAQPNDTKIQTEDANKKLLLPLLSTPSNENPQEARIDEVEKDSPPQAAPPTTISENEDESKPDQPPPRRKRSLMYAIYCTAKEDEDGEEQENGTSMADDIMKESLARIQPWLDSLNNPMPSVANNDHLANIQEEEEESGVSESSLVDSNQTVPSLTSINTNQLQLHQNVLGIKGICDANSIISTDTDSDSDESSIESPAFQCKIRYAPRLSTVERSQDGRILIKPSTSTANSSRIEEHETEVSPMLSNPDSGNASIAGDSPRVLTSNIAVANIADSICNPALSKISIEEFPPIPQAYTCRRRGREHSDSLVIHASHLGNSSSNSISKDKKKKNSFVRSQPNLHVPEMVIDSENNPFATSVKLDINDTTNTTSGCHSDDEDYIERRSRLFSILSDISDIELPELDPPHTPPTNSSFLLDGVLPPSVSALITTENDDDDDDDDDLSLAEIMAISSPSPPPPPPPTDKPVVASKKLAWVLSRARSNSAKLEGIRNLRRKKKEEQATSQQGKTFRFNEMVAVYETWAGDEYDRKGVPTIRLDAKLIDQIKQELNEYKVYEMRVHEKSRCNTHFIY